MSAESLNPPTPTFDHLGEPELWTCPRCGQANLVYPALPFRHVCSVASIGHKPRTFYFYYVMSEDHRVHSLHLVGAIEDDPLLRVESFDARGTLVRWERRSESGELVFYPPDAEWSREHVMGYSPHLQAHEAIPRKELERRALRGRHSA